MIKQEDGGVMSVCERMLQRGSDQVGIATIFVSYALVADMRALIDAIRTYLMQHPGLPRDTKFWVCDFVVRQGKNDLGNLDHFANVVHVIGHVLQFLGPMVRERECVCVLVCAS